VSFVPNAGNVSIDPPKLTYLLEKNPGKAKFFARFGFDPTRPQELEVSLRQHPIQNQYHSVFHTAHGTKYVVRSSIPTPDRRNPCVITVWMIDAGGRFLDW
jgi:hypothetical protein